MSDYSLQIRKMFGEGDVKRDAGLTTPDDVQRYDNIPYGLVDAKWQKLDVYRPKNVKDKLPVILSVHGGGWVYGDKEVYQWYCMSLAQRGFAVVNYSYRLAPEYQYPSSFEDTGSVAYWILDHAEKYGFDTNHIFGVGDSAGAHMLSLFAAALTNPSYEVPYPLPKDFSFQAIALNCGVYEMDPSALGDTRKLMQDFLPKGGTKEEFHAISPVNFITDQFPPCFIMTCPGDFLNAAPEKLIPVLKKNSVPFIYRVYGGKDNPLGHVFHCNMHLAEAKLCNDEECNFFKEFC
jgi:acetyl esterase/lipase